MRKPVHSGVLVIGLILCLAQGGCSIRRYAINKASDVLAESGSTFASDDDPELIKAAVPFSLKLMESFLAENPRHTGLLTATASGFTQYAYAFVQQDADEIESQDLASAETLRTRARRLYLRAMRYGLRGLEVKHPGFSKTLITDPQATSMMAAKADVPLLYWTAAAWASAISISKDNPELVGQIPAMAALISRALELDESYGNGAIHTFMVAYEMSRPGANGDSVALARQHFDRAIALSKGLDASPFVVFAEEVTIQTQDAKEFESVLNRALAIDPDANPGTRLANLVMQRRARWLLSRESELFLAD